MEFEEFAGMPSGVNYGTVMKWTSLDGGDFIVAFFAKGNPFDPLTQEFTWVVETRVGDLVYISEDAPLHNPVFGLDELEWQNFKHKVLCIVDAYIEKNLIQ